MDVRVGHDWATELTTDVLLSENLMDLSACLLFSLNLSQGCLGFMNSYADDTTFMAESEEELKSLLMKVKEESEKVGLGLN